MLCGVIIPVEKSLVVLGESVSEFSVGDVQRPSSGFPPWSFVKRGYSEAFL